MHTRQRLALAVAAAFVPVLWLATSATGGQPGGGPGLYPDLQTAVPQHFTVQNSQQRELLRFLETTTTNNTAWMSFRLTRDSKGNAKVEEMSHSPCSGTLCGEDLPNR